MKNRFEVSTEGMRDLHAGRPLWSLVKELVANSWDEDVTLCTATLRKTSTPDHDEAIEIMVEDDGAGFRDVDDAFTIMAPTVKRLNAVVRGRFNIGEKEILSVAEEGTVETVGTTIHFPKEGGRKITPNNRTKGTVVSVTIERPWSDYDETIEALRAFLPPSNITYTVNGVEAKSRVSIGTTTGPLQTVLASGIGQPIRYTTRKASIDIHEPLNGTGHIYEMGITIQPIDMPYDVDIQQKVPMPPNRDTVTNAYLQDVYAEVLTVVAKDLEKSEASEAWVQMGVEDQRTPDDIVELVMNAKIGPNAVLHSTDTFANEKAHDAGKDIIHPRTLSKKERQRFQDVGLISSKVNYGLKEMGMGELEEVAEPRRTKDMEALAQYAEWLGKELLGFDISVRFVQMKAVADNRIAQYGSGKLDFVSNRLGNKWFEMANGTPTQAQTSLIIHELAHEGFSKTPHTGEYVHRIADLGAKATHLAMTREWWSSEPKTYDQAR
jgi:hypothetical protein